MDNIREWISDNLRYILLGLALILVLAIAVLGVKTISNIASGKHQTVRETEAESETTAKTIVESEEQNVSASGSLVSNDAKILATLTSYYTARTNKDITTLKKLEPSIDEAQVQADLENSYVERYSDIKTYSQEGPTTGNFVVYACYNGKVKDIDTLVPSLTQFYLKSNEDGSYYIADTTGDTAAEQFIEEMRKSSEVQSLISAVKEDCKEAEDSDPVLKDFMAKYGNGSQDDEPEAETEAGEGSEVVALDTSNIRAEASTEADIIGTLYTGETVTKTGETDDGWTQVDYNGVTAYIKSELLGTQEEIDAQNEADYFAPGAVDDGQAADDGQYEE